MLADLVGIDSPISRHSQVEDQRVAAVGVDQSIFRAAAKRRDQGARQPLSKVRRKRPAQIAAPELDVAEAAALEHALKPAHGGFDFG